MLGLLAVPAVVALHLFRRRFQDLPVSALFLWEDAHRSESTGRKRQPLRRTPSFWLEVAAAALAGLLLAGFDPLSGSEAKHLVAVLDDSASMAHAPRRQAVIDALEERFAEHGRRTRVTLVRSGVRPRLLCGPGGVAVGCARCARKIGSLVRQHTCLRHRLTSPVNSPTAARSSTSPMLCSTSLAASVKKCAS